MTDPEDDLAAAEAVAGVLDDLGIEAVIIGAVALAAYGYIRFTEDIDFGIACDLPTLRKTADALREAGYEVETREPDATDPLSGVIDVTGPSGMIQLVNFGETFPAVIRDAVSETDNAVAPGSKLLLSPLAHLVVLKLYAGDIRSKSDIAEVLKRNPDTDIDAIKRLGERYRLRGFGDALDELV